MSESESMSKSKNKAESKVTHDYTKLNAAHIADNISKLQLRIGDRFPKSNLSTISAELYKVVGKTLSVVNDIMKPNMVLRVSVALVILLLLIGIGFTYYHFELPEEGFDLTLFVSFLEAGLSATVLLGAAIIFLVTSETRIKRFRTLRAISELRSLAHVIDMHQLTQDPSRVLNRPMFTTHSPRSELTPFQLSRYLDYCSEMLSLIGKISALYAQNYHDSVVITAVNEIESLTTGLSRKIWQKIMIINAEKSAS
ncbi:conserved hypothetical protein-putative membrane associated protein [hydrothermal vent metagenome]|uniref:Uncharacterized protein n=1 Tax=hydrothermal vent metagenome TaxID=652676 RepID=A0A3B0YG01_9ZZZZ